MISQETERIVRLLEKTFDKHPWYGPSIMDVLDIDPAIATKRIGNGHTIIELVRHMTSWRVFATKRLQGDNTFEVTDEMNFSKAGTWEEALISLRNSQAALVEAVKNFPESRYGELVPSKTQKYTYYTLLHGIVHHDIYHLGQIAYIRKAVN
jgi:uncharacterized damage-inducible protein DinB